MKVSLPTRLLKPRNPLVAAARRRCAGSHRASMRSVRQRGRRGVARELQAMTHSP